MQLLHQAAVGSDDSFAGDGTLQSKNFARLVHTHTFPMEDLPTALKYARERIDDAIKVVVSMRASHQERAAAE